MLRSRTVVAAAALCTLWALPAQAQTVAAVGATGTRLDLVAEGQAVRVPDIVRINAGVVTQAPTATAALAQNARQMNAVRTALKAAGIADRDIQTSSINLSPDYRYEDNKAPVLTGYRASNEVTVRFRDIANTGKIIDALVAQGANQINGPTLAIDKPEEALNEARVAALKTARARAELYAAQLGKHVGRILSVSETGSAFPAPPPMPMAMAARDSAVTRIDPGEQQVSVSLSVSFELD